MGIWAETLQGPVSTSWLPVALVGLSHSDRVGV